MEERKIVCLAALFAASVAATRAQTTITTWNFASDYVAPRNGLDYNSSPAPSTGSGRASALGMSNHYNGTNSISGPDILASPGSSDGFYAWCIRGDSTKVGSGGNGWSSKAGIGTQGAEFDVSTAGFNNIQISFDVGTTAQSERNLQLEYTINGQTWLNATLTSAGSLGCLENNTCSQDTVDGSFVELGIGWNNGITADLSGITCVNNDPNFGIRIVNASTGSDDVNVEGSACNNVSGDWCLNNVVVQSVPEPAMLTLGSLGGLSLFLLRRKKNKRSSSPNPLVCQPVFFFAQMY